MSRPPTLINEEMIARIPADLLSELGTLQDMSSGVGGYVPVGDPRRHASDEFCALALSILSEYRVSRGQLSMALGLSYDCVRLRLSSHGHGTQYPSQSKYKNIATKHTGRKS